MDTQERDRLKTLNTILVNDKNEEIKISGSIKSNSVVIWTSDGEAYNFKDPEIVEGLKDVSTDIDRFKQKPWDDKRQSLKTAMDNIIAKDRKEYINELGN